MTLTATILMAALLLFVLALIDTADRTGQRKTALLQCATLNVLLWVGLLFWVASARRDGWDTGMFWGPLVFAWACAAVCAVFLWVVIAAHGPAQQTDPTEQTTPMETPVHQGPRINGQFRSEVSIVEDALRSKYRK